MDIGVILFDGLVKKSCKRGEIAYTFVDCRGCSSVVERHVANVNVVSSSLITRFI